MLSLLAHLFVTERHRARAGNTGHARPCVSEVTITDNSIEPLMATNMSGVFLNTRISKQGYARFGFTEVDYTQEVDLLRALHSAVVANGKSLGWENNATSFEDAINKMAGNGIFPATIVAAKHPGIELHKDTRFVQAPLGERVGLVLASPIEVGLYTRVRDHAGVLVHRADRAIVAVTL